MQNKEQDQEVHYPPGYLMYPDTLMDFKTKPKGDDILLFITSKTKSDTLTKLGVCVLCRVAEVTDSALMNLI